MTDRTEDGKDAPPTPEETLKALQEVLVSLKRLNAAPGVTVDLRAAVGGEEPLRHHLQNLREAARRLQAMPHETLRKASGMDGPKHISHEAADGTCQFRVRQRILEPAGRGMQVNVGQPQLDDMIAVLRAYVRLNSPGMK